MKLTKFASIYPKPNKTNFSKFIGKSGVYIIKKGTEIVYVGMSKSDVYKTMVRHFQQWNDKQKRVTYPQIPEYKARIITCTPKQAEKLETALILRHRPKDNDQKIDFALNEKSMSENKKILEEMKKAMDRGPVPF